MAKRKLQFGRTMVEMLGVLAIIGVLSIGGLWSYRTAILRYRLAQMSHWIENIRFIMAEACANGNENGCFDTNNGSYSKRANYVCAQSNYFSCHNNRIKTPLKENLCLLHMNGDLSRIAVYLRGLDKKTCQAVIDYNWNGLLDIADSGKQAPRQYVQAGHKYLTQEQKEILKAVCPFSQYLVLDFNLKD